jgi:fatty acid desaturase
VVTRSRESEFTREVHGIVRDLMQPNPRIYWTDFLITVTVTYAAMLTYLFAPWYSAQQVIAGFIAAMGIYRASSFMHELAHIRSGFQGFRKTWNQLVGLPFMMPSFMYMDHRSHHVNHSYGTEDDAEYFPFGMGPTGLIYAYLMAIFVLPAWVFLRFAVLGPLSWFIPPLRRWVWRHASTIVTLNPRYERPLPSPEEQRLAVWEEANCLVGVVVIASAVAVGILSPWLYLKLYLVCLVATTVNYVRALSAHRYMGSPDGMTHMHQMLDSTTIEGGLLTEIWAPLGFRYHALHHILPSLPYHNMPEAHRRLMAELPADSAYHQTVRSGFWAAIWDLYTSARRESAARRLVASVESGH